MNNNGLLHHFHIGGNDCSELSEFYAILICYETICFALIMSFIDHFLQLMTTKLWLIRFRRVIQTLRYDHSFTAELYFHSVTTKPNFKANLRLLGKDEKF